MNASEQLVAAQTATFELATVPAAMQFAEMVAKSSLLPAHFRNNPANCLRLVLISSRWGFDPFMVAEKTSVINEKLMYEAQLVTAVVNSRGNLDKKLTYDFTGEGPSLKLVVSGTTRGEEKPRTITLEYAKAKLINKNGQMNINPEQQMCYIGARLWTRRHMPELILGVYTPDEMPDDDTKLPEPGIEGAKTVTAEGGNVTADAGTKSDAKTEGGRAPIPSRRGGAKDAKDKTVAGEIVEEKKAEATSPAGATPPDKQQASEPPASAQTGAGAVASATDKGEATGQAAGDPPQKRPDVAPGIDEHGFHGKNWPMVADVTVISATAHKATQGAYAKVKGTIEGHDGPIDFMTLEGVVMTDGKPTINTPLLAAGAVLNANIKAKARPKPGGGEDLTKPVALMLEAIASPDAGPFG